MNKRNELLDVFKGIAIITVILYHAGILTYGYLGVDIFLVISGYLTTKSILKKSDNRLNYLNYLNNRLIRLWPLALIIAVVSLSIGYCVMLPDAFKNTCETAIGTSTFTNNFVQFITSGNYWDTANEYKPLMHTWYLGIILQFYIIYPIIFYIGNLFSKDNIKPSIIILYSLLSLSLLLYLFTKDIATNFYLLPSRFFEFAVGGVIALRYTGNKYKNTIIWFAFFLLSIILLGINNAFDTSKIRLLLTVSLSAFIIIYSEKNTNLTETSNLKKIFSFFIPFGVASYSLYLWHQVIFAFYRYIFNDNFSLLSYTITIGFSLLIGYISYKYIEKNIEAYTKQRKRFGILVLSICLLLTIIISSISLKYYKQQGVVRDVPELDVFYNNPKTYSPQDYNQRIIGLFDKDFPQNGRKNILVVGDSYARDWVNVILESHVKNINISYHKETDSVLANRINKADIIFLANNAPVDPYIDFLPAMLNKKFYRVGHKIFGRGIGAIYNSKKDNNYYKQTIPYKKDAINDDERVEFYGMYINMMDSIRNNDSTISIFTANHKFISHDGIHLTRAGAKEFAKKINVNNLITNIKF